MDPLRPGDPQRVGTYRLLGRLGSGGMGHVFAGRSPGGRLVAVKLVRPELADDARFRRRFAQEVAAARKVGGFYTAQVVDADPEADPPWLVTAFVSGPSLHQAVSEHGPLPAEALGVLGAGLAEGLAAIHAADLVHRDLKPGNIILAADGPRVIDFGIVRALDDAHNSTTVLGTPGFMSPEQARGLQVGPPSDVFALGSVLTYAATGNGPFGTGPVSAIVYRIVHDAPDLSALPSHLADLVGACLAKDPERRPGLAEILDRLAVPAEPAGGWLPPIVTAMIGAYDREFSQPVPDISPPARAWRPTRRGFMMAGLGVASVGAAVPAAWLLRSPPADAGKPDPAPSRFGPPVTVPGNHGVVRSVAFSPDGALLAGVGDGGTADLWDVSSRAPTRSFAHRTVNPFGKPLPEVIALMPSFQATLSTVFTPDGDTLVIGNGDGTISLRNIRNGTLAELPYTDPVLWNVSLSDVAIDPAGRTLATTYDSPLVRLWDPASRKSGATLTTGSVGYWVAALAFSPSGDVLATASGNRLPGNTSTDGLLQLWDISSRSQIATLAHTNSDVHSLAFGPGGATLANLCNDGTITLWDVAARTPTATLTGPGSRVTCIGSGGKGLLAGGSKNGTVTLWDIARRRKITVLESGNGAQVTCVAVSPDGRTIAAAGTSLTTWTLT
ncbi:WD40 repeat domain-containing serine/threonine protein kinase [Spirillospora sp. CA-142024]|uniref:WD40 repeat domain-containing serine/threonine protein kinase n=1 Tax=Spirillospora sp. CA-142024 TaxID=3240036 RepID=UPI003D902CD1